MRLTSTILTTLLFSGAVALAQETSETPKVEVGLNYSFTRVNPGSSFSSFNTNGGFGDVEYNVNRHFGLVADLGATYVGTTNGVNFSNTSFEYLFGPRFNVRHGRFNPYIQTLFGGQRFSNGWNGPVILSLHKICEPRFTRGRQLRHCSENSCDESNVRKR